MRFLGIFFFIGMVMEFTTLFLMVSWLGGLATFGLIVLGFLAGAALLRNNLGVAKVMMAGQFLRGGVSFYDMMLPIRIPLAGVLLAVPTGFISSLLGLLLLIPFKGKPIAPQNHQFNQDFQQAGFQYSQTRYSGNQDDVIEGEYTVKNSSHQHAKRNDDVIEHIK